MPDWLLLSTCQTEGLANCLNLLNPAARTAGVDIWSYKQDPRRHHAAMAGASQILVNPEFLEQPGYRAPRSVPAQTVPTVSFDGYHPDLCYISAGHRLVSGPLHDYHSLLALAAYRHGFSATETLDLFNAQVYERSGYFDAWIPARDRLLGVFQGQGIDLQGVFRRWGATRPFMYSINHPRIEVLHDVAACIIECCGLPPLRGIPVLPPDNLAQGNCFPVFPEIGEVLGVQGSYLFKPGAEYRFFDLEHFVKGSFEAYAQHPPGLQPFVEFRTRFERVERVVRGEA